MRFLDRCLTIPQHIAPQRQLSNLVGALAHNESHAIKNLLIRTFLRLYDVDLTEAKRCQVDDYRSFNDFFTRELDAGARTFPSSPNAIASPADGIISESGEIIGQRLLQAKGRYFTVAALLGNDHELAAKLGNGRFATIYLAPNNYHRVHAPVTGNITKVRYIPGKLYSVNARTARCVDNLFARNERIIVEISSPRGTIVVILVGAMLVASMELVCCDVAAIAQKHRAVEATSLEVTPMPYAIERGAELGRFNMGSTVIVLGGKETIIWDANCVLVTTFELARQWALRSLSDPNTTV